MLTQRFRDIAIDHGASHAGYPLVPLLYSNGKWQMTGAQHGVTVFFDISVRTAKIAGKEQEQLLACAVQGGPVRGAQCSEVGFQVHQIVETVDQCPQSLLCTNLVVESDCGIQILNDID